MGQRRQWGEGQKEEEFHVSGAMIHTGCWGNSVQRITSGRDGEVFIGRISLRHELWRLSRQRVLGSAEKDGIFKGKGLRESRSLKPREAWVRDYGQDGERLRGKRRERLADLGLKKVLLVLLGIWLRWGWLEAWGHICMHILETWQQGLWGGFRNWQEVLGSEPWWWFLPYSPQILGWCWAHSRFSGKTSEWTWTKAVILSGIIFSMIHLLYHL